MERTFYDLKAVLMKELDKIVKKGDISPTELANVEKVICMIEKIHEIDGDGNYSMDAYPSWRGQSYGRWYPNMNYEVYGRGTSNSYSRGYSGHSIKDRMIARLEPMYDEAQSDHERQVISEWINRIGAENI